MKGNYLPLILVLVTAFGCSKSSAGPSLHELEEIVGELPAETVLLMSDRVKVTGIEGRDEVSRVDSPENFYWIVISQQPLNCPLERDRLGRVEMPSSHNAQVVVSEIDANAVKSFVAANLEESRSLPPIDAVTARSIEWQIGTKEVRLRECPADVRWLSIVEVFSNGL